MEHTKLPWELRWISSNELVIERDVSGRIIVNMKPTNDGFLSHTGQANAEFIVKCVNAHDELVKALEQQAAQEAYRAGLGASEWRAFLCPLAQQALAKVEEGEWKLKIL